MKTGIAKVLGIILLTSVGAQAAEAKPASKRKTTPSARSIAKTKLDPLIVRRAGSWTMTHTTLAFDATGVEGGMAEMAAAGKASVGKPLVGGPVCLTPKTTRKDNLASRLREAIQFGPEWKVVRSTASGGNVDFYATMDDLQQGHAEMTITGRISPTFSNLTLTTDSTQPAPGMGHIHAVMKQENVRVGDCTPDQVTFG